MSDYLKVLVVVGTYDSLCVCLNFDKDKKTLVKNFVCNDHSSSVKAIASHRQWLATGSTDETIKIYDLSNYTEVGSLLEHEGSISWLSFNGKHMFSASEDGTITIWQTGSWNCLNKLKGHKGPVRCVAVHPSGKLALSVGNDRILRTWNLSTSYLVFRQKMKEAAQLVSWSVCGLYYTLAFKKTIEVHSVESGAVISTLSTQHTISSMVFTTKEVIAVADDSPVIQLFSILTGECLAQLKGHTHRVKGLAVVPDGNLLFSASTDGSVRAWTLDDPLDKSVCVSVYETGYRLNCIAVTSHNASTTTQTSLITKIISKNNETRSNASSSLSSLQADDITRDTATTLITSSKRQRGNDVTHRTQLATQPTTTNESSTTQSSKHRQLLRRYHRRYHLRRKTTQQMPFTSSKRRKKRLIRIMRHHRRTGGEAHKK